VASFFVVVCREALPVGLSKKLQPWASFAKPVIIISAPAEIHLSPFENMGFYDSFRICSWFCKSLFFLPLITIVKRNRRKSIRRILYRRLIRLWPASFPLRIFHGDAVL